VKIVRACGPGGPQQAGRPAAGAISSWRSMRTWWCCLERRDAESAAATVSRATGSSRRGMPDPTPTLGSRAGTRHDDACLTRSTTYMSESIVTIVVTLRVTAAVVFAELHVVYIGEQVAGGVLQWRRRAAGRPRSHRTENNRRRAASPRQGVLVHGAFVKTGRRYRDDQLPDRRRRRVVVRPNHAPIRPELAGPKPKNLAAAVSSRDHGLTMSRAHPSRRAATASTSSR